LPLSRAARNSSRAGDLRSAHLTGADLTGADLTGADLRSATITQAQLDQACGTGVKLATGHGCRRARRGRMRI
jgi:uncharacterized protein YjbI with pentapeptide repeats